MRGARRRITRPYAPKVALRAAGLLGAMALAAMPAAIPPAHAFTPRWVRGDFHTHTWLTDGYQTQVIVARRAFDSFALDWLANSEHGGFSTRDPAGVPFPTPVPRWRTLAQHSFPIIDSLRDEYPRKVIIQGVEWNVPAHDHASVGIVAGEPGAVSDFEYMFDRDDTDTSRSHEGLIKQNTTHADAVAAVAWLEQNHPITSYVVLNHPSRRQGYSAADIRDLSNAAPDAVVGFEGVPGHQRARSRGDYDQVFMSGPDTDTAATERARTASSTG